MRALALFMLMVTAASAAEPTKCEMGEFDKTNTLNMPGCPKDIQSLMDRAFACDHWLGEDPYDTARAAEIDSATTELRCEKLADDHDRILRKYEGRADVMQALELADREYSIQF